MLSNDVPGHVLIAGRTASGKSTLAKMLSRAYMAKNIHCLVLDPLSDPGWSATVQTTDPGEYLEVVKQSRKCALFIDEAGESVGQWDDDRHWLATRSRHYGHRSHFISQRPTQIAKTVRDQCTQLFLFNSSVKDAKTMADEWGHEELLQASNLPQFEFFDASMYGTCERFKTPKP